jgi:hypothetical protein
MKSLWALAVYVSALVSVNTLGAIRESDITGRWVPPATNRTP